MAASWSGEHVVSEHKDLQATAMAVDPHGNFSVLAGRRYIAIVNLNEPQVTVKKCIRQSKFDVTTADWNPHVDSTFSLACNQNIELLTWVDGELFSKYVMARAHTRAVSDINWSPFDENYLASSSYDTYVHIWDVRDPRRAFMSLTAVTGPNQVKWNKVSSYFLATSHDGDVRIWDTRKSGGPVQYIAAHSSKIYGLDWSPSNEHQLTTASQDGTVKFWDVTNPKKVEHTLQSGSPVWRARYMPFGDGLVAVLVPQMRRGENSLVIWNNLRANVPAHSFLAHSDVVLEFGWRKPQGTRDYQLVTWSKDQSLHLWTMDFRMQGCSQEVLEDDTVSLGTSAINGAPLVSSTADLLDSSQPVGSNEALPPQHPPPDLEQEFSLLNINIPKVIIQELNAEKRVCCVTVTVGMHVLGLKLIFPQSYPFSASPTFQFLKGTTIDSSVKAKLLKVLRLTSEQYVKRKRSCLEPCLRQLVVTLESCILSSEVDDSDSSHLAERMKHSYAVYGSFQDSSVPFPRTSGARFCGADCLVCFTRPSHFQKMNAPTEVTPRSLSALGAYLASQHKASRPASTSSLVGLYAPHSPSGATAPGTHDVSISSFYYQDRSPWANAWKPWKLNSAKEFKSRGRQQRRTGRQATSQQQPVPSAAVLIYNMSGIMPINQILAQNYVLDSADPAGACTKNASYAASVDRNDLVQVWSLAAFVASPHLMHDKQSLTVGIPWARRAFGRKMLESIIDHYLKRYDIQTVAMLCCIFGGENPEASFGKKGAGDHSSSSHLSGNWWLKVGGSPYHTVTGPSEGSNFDSTYLVEALKRNRSNSWSDSIDDIRYMDTNPDPREVEKERHRANIKLLNPSNSALYDEFKKKYAEILYKWSLLEQRAQVLKHLTSSPPKHKGVDFMIICHYCKFDVRGVQCVRCKKLSLHCVICRVAVRGHFHFCVSCGHGGHLLHMVEWFKTQTVCPSGCGCCCVAEGKVFS